MFFEMVATLVAGVAGAGVALILNKLTAGRLPKWVTPLGAAFAMIATTVANEYAWFGRTADNLPEGLVVVIEIENQSLYRPWTYVVPFVERFVAVDQPSLRTHAQKPALRMIDTIFMGRWSAPEKMVVLADCAAGRRAPLIAAVAFDASGEVSGVDWVKVGDDDPLLTAICNVEAPS